MDSSKNTAFHVLVIEKQLLPCLSLMLIFNVDNNVVDLMLMLHYSLSIPLYFILFL